MRAIGERRANGNSHAWRKPSGRGDCSARRRRQRGRGRDSIGSVTDLERAAREACTRARLRRGRQRALPPSCSATATTTARTNQRARARGARLVLLVAWRARAALMSGGRFLSCCGLGFRTGIILCLGGRSAPCRRPQSALLFRTLAPRAPNTRDEPVARARGGDKAFPTRALSALRAPALPRRRGGEDSHRAARQKALGLSPPRAPPPIAEEGEGEKVGGRAAVAATHQACFAASKGGARTLRWPVRAGRSPSPSRCGYWAATRRAATA